MNAKHVQYSHDFNSTRFIVSIPTVLHRTHRQSDLFVCYFAIDVDQINTPHLGQWIRDCLMGSLKIFCGKHESTIFKMLTGGVD